MKSDVRFGFGILELLSTPLFRKIGDALFFVNFGSLRASTRPTLAHPHSTRKPKFIKSDVRFGFDMLELLSTPLFRKIGMVYFLLILGVLVQVPGPPWTTPTVPEI